MNNFDLKNKVAVVTGGAQGFGYSITERFILSGAKVIIWDIDESECKKAISKIKSDNCIFQIVDVQNVDQIKSNLIEIVKKFGKINIRTQSSRANESPTNANYRGVGLSEMAYCIENKKINRCNGELSYHVLDIIQSIMKASKTGKKQKINSKCKISKSFSLKEIKKILK